jgi:hypothetical protein
MLFNCQLRPSQANSASESTPLLNSVRGCCEGCIELKGNVLELEWDADDVVMLLIYIHFFLEMHRHLDRKGISRKTRRCEGHLQLFGLKN